MSELNPAWLKLIPRFRHENGMSFFDGYNVVEGSMLDDAGQVYHMVEYSALESANARIRELESKVSIMCHHLNGDETVAVDKFQILEQKLLIAKKALEYISDESRVKEVERKCLATALIEYFESSYNKAKYALKELE